MPEISVIVPVYNVEDYIEESFASLLNQTFSDIEIIAVDDGSTDSSLEKLERLAATDSRIKVISQENSGPSQARNRGMASACAPIICFMDADDGFRPNACETIKRKFDECEARDETLDILVFGADCFPRECSTPWHEDVLHPRDVTYSPFEPSLVFKEASRPFHWRVALRTDFLRESGVMFDPSLRLGEDQAFLFALYPRSSRSVLSSDVLYDYRLARAGSAMEAATSDKADMMDKHLDIAAIIFTDWDQAGFLQLYPAHMASWLVEFMIYDTLFLPDEKRVPLLGKARDFIEGFWSVDEIGGMDIPSGTKSILLSVMKDPSLSSGKARRLQIKYYMQRYGAMSAAKGVLRRIAGKA